MFPVLLLAAVLRLEGLAWGLPSAAHWFSYHPDESLVLRASLNVNLVAGRLDPGFYNYGSFLIYSISLVAQVIDAWSPLKSLPNEMARLTLIGRWEVALFGIATVYMAWLIGRRLAGRRAGLWAAVIMALLPMHVVHSHFVTVDVPATFWVSVALYNALRYPESRSALWCGIAAGVAAGTKYNAGLVILSAWTAIVLCRDAMPAARWRAVALTTLSAAVAFLVTTPGVLLATQAFLRDVGYEANHVQTGHGLVFIDTGPGWWYHLSVNLWQGIGAFLPLAALAAAIIVAAVRHRRPKVSPPPRRSLSEALTLAAFALPYFALISLAAVRFQRYDMPLLPVLAVACGCLFSALRGRWVLVPVAGLLGTLFLAQGAASTMASPGGDLLETGQPYRGDPRDAVYRWFEQMVPPGRTVGLTREPWFFSPPFSIANGGPQSVGLFEKARAASRYRVVTLPPNESTFSPRPDFVVISDYEYGDALRLQGGEVPERAAQIRPAPVRPDTDPEATRITALWNDLTANYELVGVWSPRMRAFGVSWPKRALPPHDAFYPYPTIIVFRRRAPTG